MYDTRKTPGILGDIYDGKRKISEEKDLVQTRNVLRNIRMASGTWHAQECLNEQGYWDHMSRYCKQALMSSLSC
jgi:hypothetical protein